MGNVLTDADVDGVLAAASAGLDTLRNLFLPDRWDRLFSFDGGLAGRDHPGRVEILFTAVEQKHEEALLAKLLEGLAGAGYRGVVQDVPELPPGTHSILVSRADGSDTNGS